MGSPGHTFPIDEILAMYNTGTIVRHIAEILGGPDWQPYWIAQSGKGWKPSIQAVRAALSKAGCVFRNASERAIDRHPAKKPWPMPQMIQMYNNGMSLQEISDLLSSDQWQTYWIGRIGREYRPGQKIVNKVLKKHIRLRGRGAPAGRNGFWNGGLHIDKSGYVLIHRPDHPFADNRGYVREHRLVMEGVIGRYLTVDEVVHHRDENPANNHPDNLRLFATNAEHISTAHAKRRKKPAP